MSGHAMDPVSQTELTRLLFQQFVAYHNRGYQGPAPQAMKQAVRNRHGGPNVVWLETRCGGGETTLLLAAGSRLVIGTEPDPALFAQASARFPEDCGVRLFQAEPVDALPHLLPQVIGDLCVWIDAARTRAAKGGERQGGSLLLELAEIARFRAGLRSLCVMVDGLRNPDPAEAECPEFPELDLLVDWARANGLRWHIEHDIFVARGGRC